jgi:hypothetical protein
MANLCIINPRTRQAYCVHTYVSTTPVTTQSISYSIENALRSFQGNAQPVLAAATALISNTVDSLVSNKERATDTGPLDESQNVT